LTLPKTGNHVMDWKRFGTVRIGVKILVALVVNDFKQGNRDQAGGKRMNVKTHPAESSPTGFFQFVGLEILTVGKSRNQCTHKGHQGSQVSKIAHKGIHHTNLLGIYAITFQPLARPFPGTWKDIS